MFFFNLQKTGSGVHLVSTTNTAATIPKNQANGSNFSTFFDFISKQLANLIRLRV
jgi:hypothetical protein